MRQRHTAVTFSLGWGWGTTSISHVQEVSGYSKPCDEKGLLSLYSVSCSLGHPWSIIDSAELTAAHGARTRALSPHINVRRLGRISTWQEVFTQLAKGAPEWWQPARSWVKCQGNKNYLQSLWLDLTWFLRNSTHFSEPFMLTYPHNFSTLYSEAKAKAAWRACERKTRGGAVVLELLPHRKWAAPAGSRSGRMEGWPCPACETACSR